VKRGLRTGLVMLICLMLALPGISQAGRIDAFLDFLLEDAEKPVLMTASVEAKMIPQFDEHRTEQLNRLLKHFSAEIFSAGKTALLRLMTDGEETLGMTLVREESGDKMVFSFSPHAGYVAKRSENPLIPASEEDWAGLAGVSLQLLEDGYAFFSALPELCRDNTRETAVRQTIRKVGRATRRVTVSWSRQEVEEGAFETLKQKLAGEDFGKKTFGIMLADFQPAGAQRAVLYFDEENRLIRVGFSGQGAWGEEANRKISLEWRCLHGAEQLYDELTLKTPAVRGNDRNNLILRRDETLGEQEKAELSLEYDRVESGIRTRMQGTASLAWDSRLTGEAELKTVQDGETAKILLTPEIASAGEKEYTGTLAIRREKDKITEEELTVAFTLGPGDAVPEPETEGIIYLGTGGEGDQKEYERLREAIVSAVFARLIRLPEEDLGFLLEGFTEEEIHLLLKKAE